MNETISNYLNDSKLISPYRELLYKASSSPKYAAGRISDYVNSMEDVSNVYIPSLTILCTRQNRSASSEQIESGGINISGDLDESFEQIDEEYVKLFIDNINTLSSKNSILHDNEGHEYNFLINEEFFTNYPNISWDDDEIIPIVFQDEELIGVDDLNNSILLFLNGNYYVRKVIPSLNSIYKTTDVDITLKEGIAQAMSVYKSWAKDQDITIELIQIEGSNFKSYLIHHYTAVHTDTDPSDWSIRLLLQKCLQDCKQIEPADDLTLIELVKLFGYVERKEYYCTTLYGLISSLADNYSTMSICGVATDLISKANFTIDKFVGLVNNGMSYLSDSATKVTNLISKAYNKFGDKGVVQYIGQFFKGLSTTQGDDSGDTTVSSNKDLIMSYGLLSGIINIAIYVVEIAASVIALAATAIWKVISIAVMTIFNIIQKVFTNDAAQTRCAIDSTKSDTLCPMAFIDYDVYDYLHKLPTSLVDEINLDGLVLIRVPGGSMFISSTGIDDHYHIEFHPTLDCSNYNVSINAELEEKFDWGSSSGTHIYEHYVRGQLVREELYNVEYYRFESISLQQILREYSVDVSNTKPIEMTDEYIEFASAADAESYEYVDEDLDAEVRWRLYNSYLYFFTWMTLLLNKSHKSSGYTSKETIEAVYCDRELFPDNTRYFNSTFALTLSRLLFKNQTPYSRDNIPSWSNLIDGIEIMIPNYNDKFVKEWENPITLVSGGFDDPDLVFNTADYTNLGVDIHDDYIYGKIFEELFDFKPYYAVTSGIEFDGWFLRTPRYNSVTYWVNLISGVIVIAVAAAAATVATLKIKRAINAKRFELNAACEKAWYTYTDDATTPEEKDAAYKLYKKSVLKNNIFASIFGGTKFTKSGIYDEGDDSSFIGDMSLAESEEGFDELSIDQSECIGAVHDVSNLIRKPS